MFPRILLISDDRSGGLARQRLLCDAGFDVQYCEDPAGGVHAAASGAFDVILLLQHSSTFEVLPILRQVKAEGVPAGVLVLSHAPQIASAVAAMREGAADYLHEPCSLEALQTAIRRMAQLTAPVEPPAATRDEHVPPGAFEGIMSCCGAMHEIFALIKRIAPSDSSVLVTGESGTGKEMIARAIHLHSRRREAPLLAFDCTALAPTLLESELFGHVKGSFSGAIATKKGLFEVAHQGTLMLDEVANLSVETQAKLLRLLETRRIRKVGDTEEHEVDIRLIATTNRSLAEMVKQGQFRADLYYRLNVVPVVLPPLRDRPGDIPLLAQYFLDRFSLLMGVGATHFARDAMQQLEMYSWPGNVRELRNIIERLAVLYGGSRIEVRHLPLEIQTAKVAASDGPLPETWEAFKQLKRQIVEDLERRFLAAALDHCGHNISQAATRVGMQRTNFHALLRHHRIKPGSSPES